jgi:alpha-tubulin suppressor-like RCC1 family protein
MKTATMFSAGASFGMALIRGGYVCVWGDNYWGEEAQGNSSGATGQGFNPTGTTGPVPACLPESWTLITVPGNGYGYCSDTRGVAGLLRGVTSISAGGAFASVLLANGSSTPTDTSVTPNIPASSLPGGSVATWGANYNGQLGSDWSANSVGAPYSCANGNDNCAMAPVAVAGGNCANTTNPYLDAVTAISAGYNFVLAEVPGTVGVAGADVCSWGDNTYGELGLGGTSNVNTGGDSPNFCPYVGASGSSYCAWTPQAVQSDCGATGTVGQLSNVYQISGGFGLSLALLEDGDVCAWGDNTHGEIGINTNVGPDTCTNNQPQTSGPNIYTNCALAAQAVFAGTCSTANLLTGADQISAGDFDAYVIIGATPKSGGLVCSWGYGVGGGLGNNAVADTFAPGPVSGVNNAGLLSKATCISAGIQHGLAVLGAPYPAGTFVTWGNDFAVGYNNGANTLFPVDVFNAAGVPVAKVSSISASLGATNLETTGTKGCMKPPPAP